MGAPVDDERQLFRGAVRLLVLQRVARGETYGYQLVEELRGRGLTQASESTVYPVLARLEKDGLLTARLEASGRGAARKYYRLTGAGEAAHQRALAAWQAVAAVVHDDSQTGRPDDGPA